MKLIQTKDQLLTRLAGNGDPCAFYTLILPYANAAYISNRNSGKNHNDSLSTLLPCFRKMYQNYVSLPVHGSFGRWYKEQEIKYLSAASDMETESLNKSDVKNLFAADLIHFDWALNLILQQDYSKFRRSAHGNAAMRPVSFLKREKRLLKIALIAGVIGFLLIGSYGFLSFSKTRCTVSFGPSRPVHVIFFPFVRHHRIQTNPVGAVKEGNASSKALSTESSFIHDTVKVHDTIRIFNRPKPVAPGSGLNPGTLPAISKNPQPYSGATPSVKTAEAAKPNTSSPLGKISPPDNSHE